MPPSDVARFHNSTLAAVAMAAGSPPSLPPVHRQHAAEAAAHLPCGSRMAGDAGQAGVEHRLDPRMVGELFGEALRRR